jgi:hypothetical protein
VHMYSLGFCRNCYCLLLKICKNLNCFTIIDLRLIDTTWPCWSWIVVFATNLTFCPFVCQRRVGQRRKAWWQWSLVRKYFVCVEFEWSWVWSFVGILISPTKIQSKFDS